MRRLALVLSMAFFCCCSNATLFASSVENENLNARIKLLQERLKQFQNREYKDAEEKLIVEEEAIDLILDKDESLLPIPEMPVNNEMAERLVEDFENRSDVAMTVLFHDSEFDQKYEANKSFFAMIDPPKVIFEGNIEESIENEINNLENTMVNTEVNTAFNPQNTVYEQVNTAYNPENNYTNKQEFYESLRQKVLNATRSNVLNENERQQLLASLDYLR